MTVYINFPFKATGGTATRKDPDRLSDIVNVKDWGAQGDNVTDDSNAIQAAINFAIGPRSDGTKGGRIFFPNGTYKTSNLVCGSSNSTIMVDFVGPTSGSVTIAASISKGNNTFDNIGRIEGISHSGITLSGTNQMVMSCEGQVDASAAIGAHISDCIASGGNMNPSNDPNPGPAVGSFGFALGNQCVAMDCRVQLTDIGYLVGGFGGAMVNCSAETNRTGVRLGWLPTFTLNTVGSAGSGTNVLTFSALTNPVIVGRYVTDNPGSPGSGNIPAKTNITSISTSANTINLSNNLTGTIGSSTAITFMNETPSNGFAILGFEGERTGLAYVDMYNCNGCYISGTALQGQVTSEPDPPPPAISSITWAAGTATVTCAANHNLATGQQILQMFGSGTFATTAGYVDSRIQGPGWIIVTASGSATQFTYDLPNDPGATSGTITSMTNVGTTFTAHTPARSVAYQSGLALDLAGGLDPSWGGGTTIVVTSSTTTSFTFTGPGSSPSGTQTGTWGIHGMGWLHAQAYSMRFRKVHNCAIIGCGTQANVALASLDFEYNPTITYAAGGKYAGPNPLTGSGEAEHSNNVLWACQVFYGMQLPTTNPQNKAGWNVKSAIGNTNKVEGHAGWVGVNTVANFNGGMTVANLPGNFSNPNNLYQLGPYEGQEYDINDCQVAASGNFAVIVSSGGGANHVKVRYDGTNWRISG